MTGTQKRLSVAQPITPQWAREKSMGQTKGVHQKCNYRTKLPTDKVVSQQGGSPTVPLNTLVIF